MWEPGDEAGSAAAATSAGSGGLAVIGPPTYGTTPSLSWNGFPQNLMVWYDDGAYSTQVGIKNADNYPSGVAHWTETPGTGAVYVLAF